jgi:5-methylcytosine-specific restriction endonuclease McrA
MPYRVYVRTPEWAERARRARERTLYRCSVWGRDGSLEVHHRTYERRGVERDEDVIALCATCHGLYHEWRL